MFASDDAKNATPAPANVIFDVDANSHTRLPLPASSAHVITGWLAGNSSVSVCTM